MNVKLNEEEVKLIREAILGLCGACGLSGESGTEALVSILSEVFKPDAAAKMVSIIHESHEEGLCIDMSWEIAERIEEVLER